MSAKGRAPSGRTRRVGLVIVPTCSAPSAVRAHARRRDRVPLRCKEAAPGLPVHQGAGAGEFVVTLDEGRALMIRGLGDGYGVASERLGVRSTYGTARSLGQLDDLVTTAASQLGSRWP